MSNKSKRAHTRSTATIDIGRERKERIEGFRARKLLKGEKIQTVEEAVNLLIDAGLEAETINA